MNREKIDLAVSLLDGMAKELEGSLAKQDEFKRFIESEIHCLERTMNMPFGITTQEKTVLQSQRMILNIVMGHFKNIFDAE